MMIISQEKLEMPEVGKPVNILLDDGRVVLVECLRYSARCDLGNFCRAHRQTMLYGMSGSNRSNTPKQLMIADCKMPDTKMFNYVVAICKGCIAQRAQKQK